jgi:hypothetical protein
MDLAVKQGWLKSESFQVARRVAQVQLRDEQTFRMIQSGLIGESPEIAEADILARASQLDYVLRIARNPCRTSAITSPMAVLFCTMVVL